MQHYCNFVNKTKMSSFTIDAILGKQQECAADRMAESSSGSSDEEKSDGSVGEFFANCIKLSNNRNLVTKCLIGGTFIFIRVC